MSATLLFMLLAAGPCSAWAGPVARPPTAVERTALRALTHEIARREDVDPYALEAIAMVETGYVLSIGEHCEVGHFQIMPRWASTFRLDSPRLFFDPRIGATAAARLYKHGWHRWQERYAKLAANKCFGGKKLAGRALDRLVFSALVYNYGRAPLILSESKNLGTVSLPDSACQYARKFALELKRARGRGPAQRVGVGGVGSGSLR